MTTFRPRPLLRRVRVAFGINIQLPLGNLAFREWLFSPSFSVMRVGDAVTPEKRIHDWPGPWFADIRDSSKEPLRSRYAWFRAALRVVGVDVGIDVTYLAPNFGQPPEKEPK